MRVEVVPVDSDHTEESTVVALLSTENFDLAAPATLDADCLLAERVLIDGDHILVLKDSEGISSDCVKIATDNQRSLGESP